MPDAQARRKTTVVITMQLDVLDKWSDDEVRAYIGNTILQWYTSENRPPMTNAYVSFTHKDGQHKP